MIGCETYFWGMDFKFFNILSAFLNPNNTTQSSWIKYDNICRSVSTSLLFCTDDQSLSCLVTHEHFR